MVWYDDYNSVNVNKDFLVYTKFQNPDLENFYYCLDRDFGPDRTKIALAPSGDSMITEIKDAIEADMEDQGWTGLTVELYSSRDEIMDIISDSNYEKNGVPGICFGGAFTKTDTDDYQVNMIFDDVTSDESIDSNMPNQELDAADEYQRKPNNNAYDKYRYGGYQYLQNLFANALLRNQSSNSAYVSMIYVPSKKL